ncbi:UNVERIFIED_CONTAM: hypothetical protein Sradi_4924800 [Sesamum radiatum]|uniref:Uncharacterized protein n=1 Tax=Sesamum radiatum TaxID=300843 RepID=A0AAW2MGX6_SESRA
MVPSIADPVVIFFDNNRAIAQAKKLRSHDILRHYHLLREIVSGGDMGMGRVSSVENIADPLTKPVSQIAHTQHLDKMLDRALDGGHEINCQEIRLETLQVEDLENGHRLEYVVRMVSFKKMTHPLSKRDRSIYYALGDAFILYESVATVVGQIGKEVLMMRSLA